MTISRIDRLLPRVALVAAALFSLFACNATQSPKPDAWPTRYPASREVLRKFDNPYFGQSRKIGSYTYTTDLVEARLGPNRFRIPANFYYSQMGPDFQGSVQLILLWPELAPAPPGVNFHDDPDMLDRYISISVRSLDNVPVEGFLERGVKPQYGKPDDPTLSLALRIKGDPVHGLTPYYTDFEKLDAFARREYGDRASVAAERDSILNSDWYLAYRPDGAVATHISCVSREVPDGIVFAGRRVISVKPPVASCSHEFIIPSLRIWIVMDYKRVMLKDWKRIEERVRGLLELGRVDKTKQK